MPSKVLVVIVSSLVSKPHARIDLFCMLIVVLWLIGMRDPLCVLVREFRGRNFLRGGECNDPYPTHRRIVEYLLLFHMRSYCRVTLGNDYWGHLPFSRFLLIFK